MKRAAAILLCLLLTSFPSFLVSAVGSLDSLKTREVDMSNPYEVIMPEDIFNPISGSADMPSADKSGPLPEAYDSRTSGCVTSVKNQGSTGTCWAHAACSVLESYDVRNGYKTLENADYSEAHLAWYGLNTIAENGDPRAQDGSNMGEDTYAYGGNWQYTTAALANWSGINNEEDFPLYPYDFSAMGNYDDATERFTHTSGRVLGDTVVFSAKETDRIKQWIIDNGAVTASTYRDSSLMSHVGDNYSYYCETYQTNHAITIVGWDDNYSVSNFTKELKPVSDGAWLCKDSWDNWRWNNGYFWLSYEDKSVGQFVGYTTRDVSESLNNYGYTSSYYTTMMMSSSMNDINTITTANVFIAEGNEKIDTVSFFTTSGTTIDVTVSIYKNIPDSYTNPTQGTLAASFTSVSDFTGYHTVDVPETVTVTPGERFSVCVRLHSDLYTVSAPVESSGIGTFVAHEGESFVNRGGRWAGTIQQGYGNVYVRCATSCAHNINEEITPATCLSGGHFTSYCTYCDKIFEDYDTPVGDHQPKETRVESTCTQKGYVEHYCEICNIPLDHTELELAEHTPIAIPEVPSTCTVHGSAGGVKCKICGVTLTDPSEFPLAEHDFEIMYEWSVDCKTCTATAVCRNDDHETITETVTATGTISIPATCEEMGTTTYSAEFSDTLFSIQNKDMVDIPAVGHNYVNPRFSWNESNSECSVLCICENDESHTITEECEITGFVENGQKKLTASVVIDGRTFTDEKTVDLITSSAISGSEVVNGDFLTWEFVTSTDVAWIKLSTSYTYSAENTTKNLTTLYKYTNASENISITDNGSSRTWQIRMKFSVSDDVSDKVNEDWKVSYRLNNETSWYLYDDFAPVVNVVNNKEIITNPYVKYSVLSFDIPAETDINKYGYVTIRTTDDCDKVRITVNGKSATYQKTTKNVTIDDSSEDGVIVWTIRYKFTQSGSNEYCVSARGPAWSNQKTVVCVVG